MTIKGGDRAESMGRRTTRRGLIGLSAAALAGVGAGIAATCGLEKYESHQPLPFYSGYAATIHSDRQTPPQRGRIPITWGINTSKRLIALTFDDGPMPKWTPQVQEILAEYRVRATFFLVGQRAIEHRDLLVGRLRDHEFANHTWRHEDLARLDYAAAHKAISRGARAIEKVTGVEPRLLRPPYGHLAGSTLLAAADLGYEVVLWNRQMLESRYPDDPAGLAEYIVDSCEPGTVLLAHDTGPSERMVAIRGLPAMIKGLRARGFEFVTVSELIQEEASLHISDAEVRLVGG